MIYLSMVLMAVLNSASQVFLKVGANKKKIIFILNYYTLIGYCGFFSTTVLSIFLLKITDLMHITIVVSLNFIFALIFSFIFLKESLTLNKMVGTMLIVIGVIIFSL